MTNIVKNSDKVKCVCLAAIELNTELNIELNVDIELNIELNTAII